MSRSLDLILTEDDDEIREHLAKDLRVDKDIDVEEAKTLDECIALCRSKRHVVVVVDLGIPGATGVSAVTEARQRAPGATIVVITGDETKKEDAFMEGAHEFIVKGSPESSGQKLIDTVRHAVFAHSDKLAAAPMFHLLDKMDDTIKASVDRANTRAEEIIDLAKKKTKVKL